MKEHPTPMFPVIVVGPFTKWGIDFTTYHWTSTRGNRYIIVAVEYFTKWVEAMPTLKNDGETTSLFIFNQIIARLGIPKEIIIDHGSRFENKMMSELTSNLGLRQDHSSPYYPQVNGQVEAVNKSLKTILQRTINYAKSNYHLMLYSVLWDYRTYLKTATSFSPFHLIYGLEAVFSIEFQISSLKLAVELLPDTSPLEEHLLYLEQFDEKRRDAALANKAHKQRVKCQYDRSVRPRTFSEGDLFLVYDQDKDPLGEDKFKPMGFGPFIVKEVLKKDAYHLVEFEGNSLVEPRNGLYLNKYYS
jgi:transposase InsO family protein